MCILIYGNYDGENLLKVFISQDLLDNIFHVYGLPVNLPVNSDFASCVFTECIFSWKCTRKT